MLFRSEMDAEAAAAAALETTIAELKAEFKTVFKNWRRQAGQIDWRALSEIPELGLVLPTARELTALRSRLCSNSPLITHASFFSCARLRRRSPRTLPLVLLLRAPSAPLITHASLAPLLEFPSGFAL